MQYGVQKGYLVPHGKTITHVHFLCTNLHAQIELKKLHERLKGLLDEERYTAKFSSFSPRDGKTFLQAAGSVCA